MEASGPLQGVRLIEMDAIGPVPLCGMILADLGADVVRIARPSGQAAYDDLGEAVVHRGRRTVSLNLKDPEGRAAFFSLVEQADGLMEGMRPGVMERLGLGPDACLTRNPRFVYGRATGWGQTGPLAHTAGHDINYIAMTGALHAIAQKDQLPTVPLNLVGDYAGGTMFLALGMVSAILSARSTGQGQVVDAAIVDGVANLMALFHAYLATGSWVDRPAANFLDGAAPYYRCYACADGGQVAIGPLEPQFFARLLEGLDIPADRFVQSDQSQWPAMEHAFATAFAAKPRSHWEQVFAGTDACVSPVLSMHEAMVHPANTARGVFVARDGVMQAAPAPRFSITPGAIRESEMITAEALLAEWSAN
ncbi:putative alpha-methylacyl-CoA racemase [Caenibius tardaugens NBRC 16725]|uniref:Putative alpha-methylacyl-CoA racemase n=1 Tax=Caenibius tardaugens NBRC 16725 TaxID=1219035 RepID=U2Y445_9SPHN|nr:CaiB/BaiF CoA-transferase family protein [Caenibius tardaugens]AZI36981.1 CoA transferase [Caenibius tardaugens NBRC 16725]GAD47801.1 putative alpha-methylacyl-CoA racemase [Caenibius tardaugens NBRC 16725]